MKKLIALILCLLALAGCGKQDPGTSATVFAMDTIMELTAYGESGGEAVERAKAKISELEGLWSAQREGSDLYKANHAEGLKVEIAEETAKLLEEVLLLAEETGGAFDPTIYPVMEAWGFPSGEYRVPNVEERDELAKKVNFSAIQVQGNQLTVPKGIELDLGGVGKGATGDAIVEIWRSLGVKSGLLNLGGNVYCYGTKPDGGEWTVLIRAPEGETRGETGEEPGYLAAVTGTDMAVVTSGGYLRNFTQEGKTYHHIMDPKTAAPADSGLASVTILGPKGSICDGLSTAVYVMGLDQATEYWRTKRDFEMVLYTEDGELYYTSGLKDRITVADGHTGIQID